jgi:hypothetical protein
VRLHLFNPENDLALADGSFNYCPPPAAAQIAHDLASLPLWFADELDCVVLPGKLHRDFHSEMSRLFTLPVVYAPSMQHTVTSLSPWGWSAQMRHRFIKSMGFAKELLPDDDAIASIRELSNRRSSIKILSALKEQGVDVPPLPLYCSLHDDVASFVNSRPRCVVKAPWSGSGKGIAWGIGRVEPPMENFYKGVMRRQGGVVCEEFLDSRVEFAMEFFTDGNEVTFAGYSLFNSYKGSYTGNVLASDSNIEEYLSQFLPLELLAGLKGTLPEIMHSMLARCGYKGYFGFDMMIYSHNGELRLNPCMELNLRMNMGMASRIFFDRHVAPECTGEYRVSFFKKAGEAFSVHKADMEASPLKTENGRIVSGYLNLSPVTPESRYSVSVIVKKKEN